MLNMLAMSTRVPVLMRARDKVALCYHDSCLRDPGTTTAAFYLRSSFFRCLLVSLFLLRLGRSYLPPPSYLLSSPFVPSSAVPC